MPTRDLVVLADAESQYVVRLIREREQDIRLALPSEWTHLTLISPSRIGHSLVEKAGIRLKTNLDYVRFMVKLQHLGVLEKKGYLIRRAPIETQPIN